MSEKPGLVHDGNYLVSFVDTIADIEAPTLLEINAGIELQCQITPDGLGREAEDEAVDTSRLCSVFSSSRVGRTSFEVELTLVRLDPAQLAVDEEDEAYVGLTKGKLGYLVVRDHKSAQVDYAVGDEVEVYPVECGTRSKATPAANEQQTFTIPMMVHTQPALYAEIAA